MQVWIAVLLGFVAVINALLLRYYIKVRRMRRAIRLILDEAIAMTKKGGEDGGSQEE